MLLFLLGILNSSACFWSIGRDSAVYRGAYAVLEVQTMKSASVPDPATISRADMMRFLELVRARLEDTSNTALEAEIDDRAALFYGLSPEDLSLLSSRGK